MHTPRHVSYAYERAIYSKSDNITCLVVSYNDTETLKIINSTTVCVHVRVCLVQNTVFIICFSTPQRPQSRSRPLTRNTLSHKKPLKILTDNDIFRFIKGVLECAGDDVSVDLRTRLSAMWERYVPIEYSIARGCHSSLLNLIGGFHYPSTRVPIFYFFNSQIYKNCLTVY